MCQAEDVLSIEMTAIKLLAAREHSVHELRNKLVSRYPDRALTERVLADLQRRSLLSDERFTEQYIGMRTRKGYGPLRIRAELAEKGIDSELIEAWLDGNPREWAARMREVALQRFGDNLAEDRKEQAKRARFLSYRGFPESLIRSYLWD
jgi:regulatory protein